MSSYRYNSTKQIARVFDRHGINFSVSTNKFGPEALCATYPVDMGPTVTMNFICHGSKNGFSLRIFGIFNSIPDDKLDTALRACNILNRNLRFLKFSIDTDNCIDAEYDSPIGLCDDCVGDAAAEMFTVSAKILDERYKLLAQTIYSDTELKEERIRELKRRLDALNGKIMITADKLSDNHDEDEADDDDFGSEDSFDIFDIEDPEPEEDELEIFDCDYPDDDEPDSDEDFDPGIGSESKTRADDFFNMIMDIIKHKKTEDDNDDADEDSRP